MSEKEQDKGAAKGMVAAAADMLKDQIDHRLKNPLLGSFILSWLAFNWERIAILVVSRENIYTRIVKIKGVPQFEVPVLGPHFTNTFIFPLFSALIFTLVFPFINRWINLFLLKLKMADIRTDVHISSLSEVETQKIRVQINEQQLIADKARFNSEKLESEYNRLSTETSER